jgi:hypothetical protein
MADVVLTQSNHLFHDRKQVEIQDAIASNLMMRDTVRALKQAGCAEVWMGAESGSQKVLDAVDKGLHVEAIYQAREDLRRHGSSDSHLAWLPRPIKRRIDNSELVINSRWPTMQDIHLPAWGRAIFQVLSSWRYALGFHDWPVELAWAQRIVALRRPRLESL